MPKHANRVAETTQTTGTGTLDLDGAQTGFRAFSDELTTGDTVYYGIEDDPANPTEYEYGSGTWTNATPDTLTRDTVHGSSNAGAKISLQGGTTYTVSAVILKESLFRWSLLTTLDTSSGTSSETTVIPSDTLRIALVFDRVSADGSDILQLGIGATTYASVSDTIVKRFSTAAVATAVDSGGVGQLTVSSGAGSSVSGLVELVKHDDDHWGVVGNLQDESSDDIWLSVTRFELSAALDRLKITLSGANNFDAGNVHVYTYT